MKAMNDFGGGEKRDRPAGPTTHLKAKASGHEIGRKKKHLTCPGVQLRLGDEKDARSGSGKRGTVRTWDRDPVDLTFVFFL